MGTNHVSGAVDPNGNTIAVWDEVLTSGSTTVQVRGRWLSPGGALGPELPLSGSDYAVNSDVAVAPDGRAFAAWQVQLGTNGGPPASIKGRWIEPDGSLGPILTLFTGTSTPQQHDAVLPQVVIDPNGIATVVWKDEAASDQVELRRVAPDGTLGPQLSPPINGIHEAAALPDGATFIVGGTFGDDTITVNANGTFPVAATTISTSHSVFSDPGFAFDPDGNGLAAWRMGNGAPDSVTARRIDPHGAPFGPEITVEPTTSNGLTTTYGVAVDSNGHFLVGWTEQDSGNDSHAFVRAVNLDGSLAGPRQQVSDAGGPRTPQLALDDRGTGIGVFDFSPSMSFESLAQAQLMAPDATPNGGPITLAGPRTSETTMVNDAPSGVATVLSALRTGDQYTIIARRFLEPPTCSDVSATVVQGRPIVVPLSCTGVALTGVQAATQPAHGTLAPVAGQPFSLQYTPTPGYQGSDSFLFQGSNDGGTSGNATVQIAVGKDTVPPVVTQLRLRRSRTARLSADLAKRKTAKVFYSFQLGFSEPSTAKVQIQRPVRGVRKGKKCTVRRRGSHGRPCTLYKRVALLQTRKLATSATLRVSAKQLAKLVKLGKLRASAVATDAAGNHSKPRLKKVRFRA